MRYRSEPRHQPVRTQTHADFNHKLQIMFPSRGKFRPNAMPSPREHHLSVAPHTGRQQRGRFASDAGQIRARCQSRHAKGHRMQGALQALVVEKRHTIAALRSNAACLDAKGAIAIQARLEPTLFTKANKGTLSQMATPASRSTPITPMSQTRCLRPRLRLNLTSKPTSGRPQEGLMQESQAANELPRMTSRFKARTDDKSRTTSGCKAHRQQTTRKDGYTSPPWRAARLRALGTHDGQAKHCMFDWLSPPPKKTKARRHAQRHDHESYKARNGAARNIQWSDVHCARQLEAG